MKFTSKLIDTEKTISDTFMVIDSDEGCRYLRVETTTTSTRIVKGKEVKWYETFRLITEPVRDNEWIELNHYNTTVKEAQFQIQFGE